MNYNMGTVLTVMALAWVDCACILAFVPIMGRSHGVLVRSQASGRGIFGLARPILISANNRLTSLRAATDDDDDDDDDDDWDDDEDDDSPLAQGLDSVSWLPTVVGAHSSGSEARLTQSSAEIMPLFPLGGIVYTPNSEHVLNIFEKRYREMYNDILMNGTKRFVVSMSHPSEKGRFAEVGVLFELEELKDISDQTSDQIKYICNHKVTGRVKLHRVLNPEAWESRNTYLRVEGTITDDSGNPKQGDDEKDDEPTDDVYAAVAAAGKGDPKEEKALKNAFSDLVEVQHELEEDVRFTRASVVTLAVKPGSGLDGLWQTVKLWQSFADQRLMARQNELQRDFQERLQNFLKQEKGMDEDKLPSAINFEELSPGLQKEVRELQKRMATELKPLVIESTLTMQKILEAESHTDRLRLLRHFVEAETRRLQTKKSIQGMFADASSLDAKLEASLPAEERLEKDDDKKGGKSDASSSLFTDEDDAFQ